MMHLPLIETSGQAYAEQSSSQWRGDMQEAPNGSKVAGPEQVCCTTREEGPETPRDKSC